jgi:8-oxo-dGTP diphosphatase
MTNAEHTSGEPPEVPEEGATQVVTAFLLRRDRDRDEVLLVRRSARVRTYQGRWAGVSGYLEPGVTPLEQAYTEIREETGLDREAIDLRRSGQPMLVRDPAASLVWLVHPFLFEVKTPERIRIDWEATEMQWVAPHDIAGLDTVPGLAEAFARVYASAS